MRATLAFNGLPKSERDPVPHNNKEPVPITITKIIKIIRIKLEKLENQIPGNKDFV